MQTPMLVAQHRYPVILPAAALAVVAAAAIALLPVEFLPHALAALAALAGLALWAINGRLWAAVACWFVTVICLDEQFWRAEIPFFFNVTVSRIAIVVLVAVFAGMRGLGRVERRPAAPGWYLLLAMVGYYTLSAAVSGFKTAAVASVHYRLIGGYWFAAVMFLIAYCCVDLRRDARRLLGCFCLIGVYLAFTGWCEQLHLWSMVWPRYIADPAVGIHWGRVRGPFVVSPTMGLGMLFCLFAALALARESAGPRRAALYLLAAALLPPIFWTQTRSVWLGLVLGTMVWVFRSGSRLRGALVFALAAAAVVLGSLNVENLLSEDRQRGGLADMEPVHLRIGLALISLDMAIERPLTGVGFGHFRDAAPAHARDLGSTYREWASPAMEHNNLLSVLAETGAVGLALYIAVLWVLLAASYRTYQRMPATAEGLADRRIIVLYWVLFIVYMVDGMFRETSVHPFTNCLFFGVSGLVAGLGWVYRSRRSLPATAITPEPLRSGRDPAGLPA